MHISSLVASGGSGTVGIAAISTEKIRHAGYECGRQEAKVMYVHTIWKDGLWNRMICQHHPHHSKNSESTTLLPSCCIPDDLRSPTFIAARLCMNSSALPFMGTCSMQCKTSNWRLHTTCFGVTLTSPLRILCSSA